MKSMWGKKQNIEECEMFNSVRKGLIIWFNSWCVVFFSREMMKSMGRIWRLHIKKRWKEWKKASHTLISSPCRVFPLSSARLFIKPGRAQPRRCRMEAGCEPGHQELSDPGEALSAAFIEARALLLQKLRQTTRFPQSWDLIWVFTM